MHGTWQKRRDEQTNIQRNIMQGTATLCSSPFGRACKGVWPVKTAEELASRAGCSVRAAAYQLSGEHDPSVQSMLALVAACTPQKRQGNNGNSS
jgi:hypothetical protein